MRKQECSPPPSFPLKQNTPRASSCLDLTSLEHSVFPSKNQFVEWLKGLSNEERFLAVQIKEAKVVSMIRASYKKLEEEKQLDVCKSVNQLNEKGKKIPKQAKNLIEGIIFLTSQDYLDTIGFDFCMVEYPERIYDMLNYFQEERMKKTHFNKQETSTKCCEFQFPTTKQNWLHQLVQFFKNNFVQLYGKKWNPQILQDEKFRKREFTFYWKHLSPQEKLNILYLDCFDVKELILKLIDMGIHINPSIIESEIDDLLKIDKNEFCNRIFKCKLKKSSFNICSYYQLIYYRWKESLKNNKKKRNQKINKNKTQKKSHRNKSLGNYSNETNETQYKEEKFDINIKEMVMNKVEDDIINCSNLISENANLHFEQRVLAFERIQNILHVYQIPVTLYGSCASGIAIEQSDVDIALDDKILFYCQHLSSTREKIEGALGLLCETFSHFSWISGIKLISKAKVPLLKLTVNTNIPVQQNFFPENYQTYLSRKLKHAGKVNIDLTIQTKNQDKSSQHLGIISTKTMNSWLEQIPTLRSIIIILKYCLTKKQLNETYVNGLNTYCLMVMVVAYLKYARLLQEKNVGVVLGQLLQFYGWEFDQNIQKIDLLKKQIFIIKPSREEQCAALEIIDPLEEGRVMTRNCYKFDEIKQIMREISKKCLNRTINEVQEFCSQWNPKEKFLTSSQLHEMVSDKLKENHFISELK